MFLQYSTLSALQYSMFYKSAEAHIIDFLNTLIS